MDYTEILKDLRMDHNEKQEDVAKILGISRSSYNDYENQITIFPIKHLETLCNHYNISIDYFLGLTKKTKYKSFCTIDKIKAGERLKEFRNDNKLTQKDLATILNTTFSSIAWNEKGRNLISTSFLYKVCKTYHISADYLLGRINEPKYLR